MNLRTKSVWACDSKIPKMTWYGMTLDDSGWTPDDSDLVLVLTGMTWDDLG